MSVSKLKFFAFIFMLIDHICFFFSEIPMCIFFRSIGRIAAPIFFFCFVEGYLHTKNKKKYETRLFTGMIIMLVLNLFMFCILSLNITPFVPNMFFTFFVMFQIMDGIDRQKYFKLLFLIFVPFMEYSYFAFFSILVFRYIKNKYIKHTLFLFGNLFICVITDNYFQVFMILSVLFLIQYNGQNGKHNSKLYYFMYPIHFYLLAFIRAVI